MVSKPLPSPVNLLIIQADKRNGATSDTSGSSVGGNGSPPAAHGHKIHPETEALTCFVGSHKLRLSLILLLLILAAHSPRRASKPS